MRNSKIVLPFSVVLTISTALLAINAVIAAEEQPPAQVEELAQAGFVHKAKWTPPPGSPPGAFGANRMVYAPSGTRGLAGDFTLPAEQSLGSEEYFQAPTYHDDPNNPGYVIVDDAGLNTYKNKPTFYFGAGGDGFQSDVGFQYEGLVANGLPPGWSAFASVTLQSYVTRNPDQKEQVGNWYQSTNPSNRMVQDAGKIVHVAVSLDENGIFSIDTDALPIPAKVRKGEDGQPVTYYPQLYPQDIYHTGQTTMNTSSIEFRRVIGMTQNSGTVAASSDSYVHNLGFNNGTHLLWSDNASHNWSNGTHTYQPGADNKGRGKTINGKYYPLFMVDSEKPWERLPDGNYRPDNAPDVPSGENVHSRYFQEAVNIDLLAPAGQIMPNVPKVGTHDKKK